ncbi:MULTISPECIES: class I adenylate-forming enzyme family protein [unclassified Variovorax]|uniref:class I adenylate-forming enzyme family protein n=1 Tax=unclassified Variovorax TaxID=663243 RepID=UPI001BD5F0B2|nr:MULTISPECIES: AMP-binding protein [unclassified Variovorax]
MAITQLFARGATLFPARICLQDATGARRYDEVHAMVTRIAGRLNASDQPTGEKCAVYSPNASAAVECLLGIQWAGAVYVPLNPKNHASENIAILDNCDVSTLFFHSSLASEVDVLRAHSPKLMRCICIDAAVAGAQALENWIGDIAPRPQPFSWEPNDVVSLYSTGGTTGLPKGVMLTSLNWDIAAANFHAHTPVRRPPVFLAVSPITHAAGTFSFMLMALGGRAVILPGFDAGAILDAIEREKVTHLYLPPTAIYMLLEHASVRGRDYSSLEYFIYTSAPMSVTKLRQCLEIFGPVMIQFWGQTEAPSFCTCLSREDHSDLADSGRARRLLSCGQPMLLTPVAAMDDDGHLLGAGEKGELVVNGPLVMAGYYKNAAATAGVSTHGWHHTGDVGYVDSDGFVFIVDRKKEMIITGGYNVYPREVESVLLSHTAIQECAVVGAPDEKWGEAVTGVIELKAGSTLDAAEVMAWCKTQLGSIKAPKSVQIWAELPRTSVGKVDKKAIRKRFWDGNDRAI